MAKSNDPLANLAPTQVIRNSGGPIITKDMDNAALIQLVKDQHEHMVRMQQQLNALEMEFIKVVSSHIEGSTSVLDGTFEAKVWETVMVGALTAALGPNKVLQDTPKAMQQMIGRALRLADSGVEAAKAYQRDQELQRKDQETSRNNDPLKQLINN